MEFQDLLVQQFGKMQTERVYTSNQHKEEAYVHRRILIGGRAIFYSML